jgi:hypothetical protein
VTIGFTPATNCCRERSHSRLRGSADPVHLIVMFASLSVSL